MSQRTQQKNATAQRLFEVAVSLFRTQGYEATTVEAITNAAGVAKGTFFNHFASKHAVLDHLGRMQVAQLAQLIDDSSDFFDQDTRSQIRFIFRTLAEGAEERRDLMRLIAIEVLRQSSGVGKPDYMEAFERLLTPVVRQGQERGAIRRDISPERGATVLRGLYYLILLAWLECADVAFTTLLDTYLDVLLEGVITRDHSVDA
jgi:AcrR family transcriptional regulator